MAESERDQTRKILAVLGELPEPGDAFKFAVVADTHQYVDELSKIVVRINRRSDINFVAHLGDMTDVGLREEYRATLVSVQPRPGVPSRGSR